MRDKEHRREEVKDKEHRREEVKDRENKGGGGGGEIVAGRYEKLKELSEAQKGDHVLGGWRWDSGYFKEFSGTQAKEELIT